MRTSPRFRMGREMKKKLAQIIFPASLLMLALVMPGQAAEWVMENTGIVGARTDFCDTNTVLAQYAVHGPMGGPRRVLIDVNDTKRRRNLEFPLGKAFYILHCANNRALVRVDHVIEVKKRQERSLYDWAFTTDAAPELIVKGNGKGFRVFPGPAEGGHVIAAEDVSDASPCHFDQNGKVQVVCLDQHHIDLYPFSRGVIAEYGNQGNSVGEPDYAVFIYDLAGKRIARLDQDVNFWVSPVNYWMSPDGGSVYAACKKRTDLGSTLALFRICRLALDGPPYRWEEIARIENDGRAAIGTISLDAARNIYFDRPGLHGGGIWRIDAKTKRVSTVIRPDPSGLFMSEPHISADGTRLTFDRDSQLIIAHLR